MIGTSCLFFSLALQASASIFFHQASYIALLPEAGGDHQTFGFSMAYQENVSLVTGAPHSGLTGKVFRCPLNDVLTQRTGQCADVGINVDELAPYSRDLTPDLKLNLGASISARPDYFFTCAPLWPYSSTDNLRGTCFVHNGTSHRYKGVLEQSVDKRTSVTVSDNNNDIVGGTGWRTLIDQANDVLMIAKVALKGDIAVVNASRPLGSVKSFMNDNRRYFESFENIGTSMVAGKFFRKSETLYAISSFNFLLTQYRIHFMYAKWTHKKVRLFLKPKLNITRQDRSDRGSMFGAAMWAADLDNDGFAELLVGAPAQADSDGAYESGALHIYLGGDQTLINDIGKHCLITGTKEGSRFGAAIASSDVDGDDFPEIFVSAPYEDYGNKDAGGALYVLSGLEVKEKLLRKPESIKEISLSQLTSTQRIESSKFRTLGYSMQIISDLDNNGCNELAVGSPGSDNIMLLRCVPAIKVEVYIKEDKQIVKEQDESFTREVCLDVTNLKQKPFSITLQVTNNVTGGKAEIESDHLSFSFEINEKTENPKCQNITVHLNDQERHTYTINTEVKTDEGVITNSTEFNRTWVTISQTSKMFETTPIQRHCVDKDCEPNITISIGWSGENGSYILGSSDLLTVSLFMTNVGNSPLDSCVRVKVSGAPIAKFGCTKNKGDYKCLLPSPFNRATEHQIDIKMNMSQPSNLDKAINVRADLFEYCDSGTAKTATFELKFNLTTEDITLKGLNQNQNISDTKIQDNSVLYVNDAHEYLILNNGSVYWEYIEAEITFKTHPFIDSYQVFVPRSNCSHVNSTDLIKFTCTFGLQPQSPAKIIASTRIIKSKIMENLVDGKLNITSKLILYLKPTLTSKDISLLTTFTLQKEQSLAQNKGLVIFLAILGAVIALGVLVFIMYKMDFFKRKEKTKLDDLKREHVRRQSVKRSMSISHDRTLDDVMNNMDLEVVDDSPFEVVDITEPVLRQERLNGDK